MSCEFSDHDSSSESDFSLNEDFSLCNDLCKLQPYSFESIVSSSDENEVKSNTCTQVEVQNEEDIIVPKRVGNIDWCLCKCCKPMESEAESLCCRETNEFPEESFQGMY